MRDAHHPSCPLRLPTLLAVCLLLAVAQACGAQGVTKFTLPTGVRVLVTPDTNSEVVAVCVFVRAGVAEEEGTGGVGFLTARALFGSNLNQSREMVNRAIYAVGGSLETIFAPDYTLLTCVTTRPAFEDAFYILAQALKSPDFDPETFRQARREAADNAAGEAKDPFRSVYTLLRGVLYQDSPYRVPFGGAPESVSRLSPEAARRFFQKRYTPANTVISICGHITVEQARRVVENQLLPDYDRPAARPIPPSPLEPLATDARATRRLPVSTTQILLGFRAPALEDPDYPAFAVLNALIGGGKSSRLFRAVRDTAGVGYSVGTYAPALARPGHMVAYVEFDPARADGDGKALDPAAVEKLLLESTRSVLQSPPTPQEVERAKRYTAGTYALAHQRTRDRAFYSGWYELVGPGYAFDAEYPKRLATVTGEDLMRVARKYLDRWAVAIVQPQ